MTTTFHISKPVEALLKRGVIIPCPASIEVDERVNPEHVAPGVVLHTGSKLLGASLSIGPGCEIGGESPATVEDCQLGRGVSLKGGFFSGAVFLDGASMGSCAHVRGGTILEEEASGAHSVGFKQTVLFPFVTAGSLINFCDALMAGGTSRRNHSEIGSSYIHFNFTPHGDKATASMVGDVPRGVMLDRPPVFLGGQGGLVGPARVGFGCVLPAGVVLREDAPEDGMLVSPSDKASKKKPYAMGSYREVGRVVRNNLLYIGNIRALQAWYKHVRREFMGGDAFETRCWEGAVHQLDVIIAERIKRLGELAAKMKLSLELAGSSGASATAVAEQERLLKHWPQWESRLKQELSANLDVKDRDALLKQIANHSGEGYLQAVQGLAPSAKEAGTKWLQAVVDSVALIWDAKG